MLKAANDGLSKVWKPVKVWDPFYNGGKIVFSSSEDILFSEFDGNVKIVSVKDPSQISNLVDDEEAYEKIATFCIHPSKREIVVATAKFSLRHWDLESKTCIRNIKAHKMPILCMEYDSTGTLVATGSADRTVRVWDIAKGYCTHNFTGHTDLVRTVLFQVVDKQLYLLSTSDDASIRIFDLAQSSTVAVFNEHVGLPTSLAVGKSANVLISAGRDKVLNFYNLSTRRHLLTVPVLEELESVAVLPAAFVKHVPPRPKSKGQQSHLIEVFMTAGSSGVLKIFALYSQGTNMASLEVLPLCTIPTSIWCGEGLGGEVKPSEDILALKGLSHVGVLSSSDCVVSVSRDHNICMYAIDELISQYKAHPSAHNTPPPRLAVQPQRTLVGGWGDILDLSVLASHGGLDGNAVKYSMAVVTNSHVVRVVSDTQRCELLEGHGDIVLGVDSSPDGRWLATCSKDHTSRLWHHEAAGWRCRAVCSGHTEAVSALAISQFHATYASRKVFMITGAADRVIKKFSLPLHTFAGDGPSVKILSVFSARAHEKDINCIALSPNDQIAATASQDKTIKLWNTEDLSAIATLKGHKRGVWKVVFSPVDKVLLSCSGDRTMKLWSVVDYTQLRTIEGHSASVLNAIYVNYATQIMSCAADGLVRLNTVKSGECEHTADEHADRIWAMAALPIDMNSSQLGVESKVEDGKADEMRLGTKFICTGGSDGRLMLWKDVTVEEEQKRIEEEEQRLVVEQQLSNHMAMKRYKEAIQAALSLNMSNKLLQIFTAILEEENTSVILDRSNVSMFQTVWSKRLDQYVREWSDEEIKKIVVLIKEWNANSRYCYICQVLIHSLLRLAQCDKLMALSEFKESLPALVAYTDRHYQRINRLSEAAFLLEYVAGLSSIPVAIIPNTNSEIVEEEIPVDQDSLPSFTAGSSPEKKPSVEAAKVHLVSGSEDEHDEKAEAAEPTQDSLASEAAEAPATATKRKRTKKEVIEEPPTPDTRKSSRTKKARV